MALITVAEYLYRRLKELGIDDVFGVPGDYNLSFVDLLENHNLLKWRGCCNELNAAYSADGYARVKGFSALITTYGVGELSALNGVAGAFAEQVPIIHIAGGPSQGKQDAGRKIHHSLGNGRFDCFEKIYRNVCYTTASLNFNNACDEIDRVLLTAWKYRYPVYLLLPEDVALYEVIPPERPLSLSYPKSYSPQLHKVTDQLISHLTCAKKVCVIIGEEVCRYKIHDTIAQFLTQTKLPFFSVWGSKGAIDEHNNNFGGLYRGGMSAPDVKEFIESSDVILSLGVSWDEINTGGFTQKLPAAALYDIHSCEATISGQKIYAVSLFDVLNELSGSGFVYQGVAVASIMTKSVESKISTGKIRQCHLSHAINSIVTDNSIVVADTGTSLFQSGDLEFKKNCQLIIGKAWASIGYATPATLGAAIAKNNKGRTILITGDGAFQMTAQELSSLCYHDVKPVVIILNNHGYTIERLFHGKNARYNDIQEWKYTCLPEAFGCDAFVARVSTMDEFYLAIKEMKSHKDKLCLIELEMDKYDQPQQLLDFVSTIKNEQAIMQKGERHE